MTAQEALKIIQSQINQALYLEEYGQNEGIKAIYQNKMAWLIVVKEALEKQIPKKPKNREGTTYFYCPCCDSKNINEYCGECGQALDWSDTE